MIRRVLISLDGSELSELVVPHLLRFIVPGRTEILLMTVFSSSVFSIFKDSIKSPTPEQILMLSGDKAYEQIQVVAQKLSESDFKVKCEVLLGEPAKGMLQLAEEESVELIAMSTHGRAGLRLALLGSVANEVVCNSRSPIFLAPPKALVKPDPLPRTIFLALDGTPLAETAIPAACWFAQNADATIHLVRVVELHDSIDKLIIKSENPETAYAKKEPIIEQAVCYLKRIQLRLQLAGITSYYQIAVGSPAESISRILRAENADLIVMSTHGRQGVERNIFGSVVSQVISDAICPMLIMRGKVSVGACDRDPSAVPVTSYSC